jgi:hypothetical protein
MGQDHLTFTCLAQYKPVTNRANEDDNE